MHQGSSRESWEGHCCRACIEGIGARGSAANVLTQGPRGAPAGAMPWHKSKGAKRGVYGGEKTAEDVQEEKKAQERVKALRWNEKADDKKGWEKESDDKKGWEDNQKADDKKGWSDKQGWEKESDDKKGWEKESDKGWENESDKGWSDKGWEDNKMGGWDEEWPPKKDDDDDKKGWEQESDDKGWAGKKGWEKKESDKGWPSWEDYDSQRHDWRPDKQGWEKGWPDKGWETEYDETGWSDKGWEKKSDKGWEKESDKGWSDKGWEKQESDDKMGWDEDPPEPPWPVKEEPDDDSGWDDNVMSGYDDWGEDWPPNKDDDDDKKMGGQESDEEKIMWGPQPPPFPPPSHIREDGAPTIDSEEIALVMDALQAQYEEDAIDRRQASSSAEGPPEERVIGLAPQPKRKVRIRAGRVVQAARLKGALAQLGVKIRR